MLWNWNLNSNHIELEFPHNGQIVLKFRTDTPNKNMRAAKPPSRIFIIHTVQYKKNTRRISHLYQSQSSPFPASVLFLPSSVLLLLQCSSLTRLTYLCLSPDSDTQFENMCKKELWEIPEAHLCVICKHYQLQSSINGEHLWNSFIPAHLQETEKQASWILYPHCLQIHLAN